MLQWHVMNHIINNSSIQSFFINIFQKRLFFRGHLTSLVQAVFDSYPEKRSAVEWAFRWLCNFPQIATVLSGVTNMEQTMDNLAIFDRTGVNTMSEEELAIVTKAREEYLRRTKVGCTGCRYCMPCPCGVDIPAIFGTWNEAFKYNTNISGNGRYRRMVEENKGANQCVECGACMEMCPQQLNIPELLKAASAELS